MASGMVESSHGAESSQQQKQGVASKEISRSQLVQRLLAASSNLPQFLNDLLTTQAVVVAGTEAAAFVLEHQPAAPAAPESPAGALDEPQFGLRPIAHIRPDQSSSEQRAAALAAFQEIIRPCIAQGKDGAVEVGSPDEFGEVQYCLVTLLRSEGNVVAVSAVIARCRDLERARQRLISMQLVAGYFELFSLRKGSEQSRVIAQSHQHVLQLATAVATAEGFESAAMNLCNELATRTGASRVAIGWLKGKYVRVKALSNTEKFDKKQELIVQIEKAMEECVDQEEIVKYDPTPGGKSSENVTRAAAELSRAQGGNIVLSLPLRRQSEIVGVATLEFSAHQALGENAASGLAIAVDLLAPQLYDRHMNDRWLVVKTGHSIKETAKLAIGPKFMLAKVIIAAVIVLGLFMTFYKPMYHVSAPFQFVPVQKVSVSAPYDGYIHTLAKVDGEFVGPSTKVKKGQVLAELVTTDLVLKKGDAMAKANEQQKVADKAYAEGKIADYTIALAQREQALAQAKLYQYQIDQAKIVAPYDGEILRGDLRDKIGAPVKQGDVLFEIADRSQLEAELKVSDRDIRDVHVAPDGQALPGSKGMLATTSLPSEAYPFKISRIVPIGEAQEGTNVFKVYATLDGRRSPDWRPGLTGQARIDVRPEPLIWIWTHKVIEFLRLELWV